MIRLARQAVQSGGGERLREAVDGEAGRRHAPGILHDGHLTRLAAQEADARDARGLPELGRLLCWEGAQAITFES